MLQEVVAEQPDVFVAVREITPGVLPICTMTDLLEEGEGYI
jgi:hypothetical protein